MGVVVRVVLHTTRTTYQQNELLFQSCVALIRIAALYKNQVHAYILANPGEQSVHRDDFGVEAFIEALDDYQLEPYVRS